MGQMSLFDEAEIEANPKAAEPDLKEVQGYRRRDLKVALGTSLGYSSDKRLCTLAEVDRSVRMQYHWFLSVGIHSYRNKFIRPKSSH